VGADLLPNTASSSGPLLVTGFRVTVVLHSIHNKERQTFEQFKTDNTHFPTPENKTLYLIRVGKTVVEFDTQVLVRFAKTWTGGKLAVKLLADPIPESEVQEWKEQTWGGTFLPFFFA
jgi:hypothetical protein